MKTPQNYRSLMRRLYKRYVREKMDGWMSLQLIVVAALLALTDSSLYPCS